MISLDHMILRVRNQAESVRFYRQILVFEHEGRVDPFEILRVHEGLTLDLMEQVPQDQVHLAFCLERTAFEAIHRRLIRPRLSSPRTAAITACCARLASLHCWPADMRTMHFPNRVTQLLVTRLTHRDWSLMNVRRSESKPHARTVYAQSATSTQPRK
jgi:hypothetical protein